MKVAPMTDGCILVHYLHKGEGVTHLEKLAEPVGYWLESEKITWFEVAQGTLISSAGRSDEVSSETVAWRQRNSNG